MFPSWSVPTDADVQAVTRQLGKAPRGLFAVACRCRFGSPQVVVTNPVVFGPGRRSERSAGVAANDVRVFPTTYWLTCPYLATAVARLENEGWVGRLRAWLTSDDDIVKTQAEAHARAAQERVALVQPEAVERLQEEQPAQWQVLITAGIGGIRAQAGVKCLHAHLADYLAGPVGEERAPYDAQQTGSRNLVGARVLALLLQQGVDVTGWPGCRACLQRVDDNTIGGSCSRIAAMDVGTNSCRLLLTEVKEAELNPIYAALETTRLGQGLQSSGELAPQAVERTIAGLRRLLGVVRNETQNTQVVAVATNAVRTAANPESFLIPAWEQLRLAVRVVTGPEEAELSFHGALANLKPQDVPPSGRVCVLDIGGGSTELVAGNIDGTVTWSGSVVLGAVRLTEIGVQADIGTDEGKSFEAQILRAEQELSTFAGIGLSSVLVGVGGTCTTLAAIDLQMTEYQPELVQGYVLTRERITAIAADLYGMSLEQRRQIPGLQPARADIIIAGIAILLAAMRILDQSRIVISDSDILLGVAHQFFGGCVTATNKV